MLRNASIFIKIEPGRVDPGRFWWSVFEGTRVLARSPYSYATRREAESAASEVLKAQSRIVSGEGTPVRGAVQT